MMWMGKLSAIAALALGAVFVGIAVFSFDGDIGLIAMAVIGALLALGGFRTLRKMSGGLRLLCGAWGLAAGYSLIPIVQAGSLQSFFEDFGPLAYAMAAITLISASGLALTVLHQERK
ncbi:MAG: hypothetical protein JNJ63_08225 [Hyphomonadaceae bacterium]|nr:hypothetical protein [Hyphomonadaceae bacterium]